MALQTLRRWVPYSIKHPLITSTKWYWTARALPAQSLQDISIIKALLVNAPNEKVRVWEWGSGKSTIYYSKFLRRLGREFEWHAAENSRIWSDKCSKRIAQEGLEQNVHVHCCEFPPFWDLPSYSPDGPAPQHFKSDEPNIEKYVNFPKEIGGPFDLIVIDGRYRRRCLLVAPKVLAPNGVVMLHDAQRTHYHASLSVYPHVRMLETGGLPGTRQKSTVALCSFADNLPGLDLPD